MRYLVGVIFLVLVTGVKQSQVLVKRLRLKFDKKSQSCLDIETQEKKSRFHLEIGTKKKVSLMPTLLRLRVINSWSQSCTQKYVLSTLHLRICSAINKNCNNFLAEPNKKFNCSSTEFGPAQSQLVFVTEVNNFFKVCLCLLSNFNSKYLLFC